MNGLPKMFLGELKIWWSLSVYYWLNIQIMEIIKYWDEAGETCLDFKKILNHISEIFFFLLQG